MNKRQAKKAGENYQLSMLMKKLEREIYNATNRKQVPRIRQRLKWNRDIDIKVTKYAKMEMIRRRAKYGKTYYIW